MQQDIVHVFSRACDGWVGDDNENWWNSFEDIEHYMLRCECDSLTIYPCKPLYFELFVTWIQKAIQEASLLNWDADQITQKILIAHADDFTRFVVDDYEMPEFNDVHLLRRTISFFPRYRDLPSLFNYQLIQAITRFNRANKHIYVLQADTSVSAEVRVDQCAIAAGEVS